MTKKKIHNKMDLVKTVWTALEKKYPAKAMGLLQQAFSSTAIGEDKKEEKTGPSKSQEKCLAEVIECVFASIENIVAGGDKAVFIGFGTFEPSQRKARIGRNPQTGAKIEIPASTTVRFKVGKTFKTALNEKKG